MADDRSLRGPQIVNGSICPRTTRCGPKKARKIIDYGMAVFSKKHANGHETAA
jgi:hypothetical protein